MTFGEELKALVRSLTPVRFVTGRRPSDEVIISQQPCRGGSSSIVMKARRRVYSNTDVSGRCWPVGARSLYRLQINGPATLTSPESQGAPSHVDGR